MKTLNILIQLVFSRCRKVLGSRRIVNACTAAEAELLLIKSYNEGTIRTIYDIGANKGLWSRHMKSLMPKANFILFEANPLHEKDLQDSGFEFYTCLLGRSDTDEIDFYSTRDNAGSTGGSIYKEVTPQYDGVHSVRLPTSALSTLVHEFSLPNPDLVKIDTQGAELDVIEGGRRIIEQTNYLILELPIIEYNKGAPSIHEYLAKILSMDFVPISVSEIHRYGPVIIQLDLVFISKRLLNPSVITGLRL